jgi:predicted DCC family thiol-disulfide oxidoreductase YuxK
VNPADALTAQRRAAASGRHIVLYDRDCGFCRWSLAWIVRWDRRHELVPVALQDPVARELLRDLDEEDRMASWHLISPDGERASGGTAAVPLLRTLPGGAPLAALLGAAPRITDRAYAWVTRHRAALGRPITRGAADRARDTVGRRPLDAGAISLPGRREDG